jgi:succinyl-CoA synthetase beta subunit
VVKAQVLTGGRGKAGGVKVAASPAEAADRAADILGMQIKGFSVEQVLVAKAVDILREYYLGITLDRSRKQPVCIASASGGVDIEQLAVEEPEKIRTLPIDPIEGVSIEQLNRLVGELLPEGADADQVVAIASAMYDLFRSKDCGLVEINPCVQTPRGFVAADAKITFDDNALYRHEDVASMRQSQEYSSDEVEAREAGLSFVGLEGEIGCMVNGAGLAMATMDLIKLFGGTPANFLDVGGSSNPQKVLTALRIILRNPTVKAILINIFGGITRCDDIARGIVMARDQIGLTVPLVIRLVGTNEEEGRAMLTEAGIEAMEALSPAVEAVVERAGGRP